MNFLPINPIKLRIRSIFDRWFSTNPIKPLERYILYLVFFIMAVTLLIPQPVEKIISPLASTIFPLHSLEENKNQHEVFGFLPWWNFRNDTLESIDFNVLTTLAFFDVKILPDGNLDTEDEGYRLFKSKRATGLFKKAHANGTKVVLTLTIMDIEDIEQFLDNTEARARTITQATRLVKERGIDGINVDIEYFGDNGKSYRGTFTNFVTKLTQKMHDEVPGSKVSYSIYASAVKNPRLYDVKELGAVTDATFIMAYDYALGSDKVMPTAPLYGYKDKKRKYWYDVSTAVEDFLTLVPSGKLILGNPWYGIDVAVDEPTLEASAIPAWYWGAQTKTRIYSYVQDGITERMHGISDFKTGFDELSKTPWKAYYSLISDTWRMVFYDDVRSLSYKYDFAKSKDLLGVGIWAIGYEEGKNEMWELLGSKFGPKFTVNQLEDKPIDENI